ncbi:hypothetical protein FRB96_001340 [Tulasnella sp. 330]|nr:hypothetical protein FRB96_001340 [Tulasnella sp. 330]
MTIVIVGGGHAGVLVASTLSQALDPSSFKLQMIFAPGNPGEIVVGSVARIDDVNVYLAIGRALNYDWLVLATGTKWRGPLDFPLERDMLREWLDAWNTKLWSANEKLSWSVVVLRALFLKTTYPSHYRQAMLDAAINKGINFVLMDRVCLPEGPRTSVKTENGAVIPTGMVIDAQRGKLNTDFLTSFNPTIVTETGGVKLLPTLQVPLANGKSNVFALGDIIEGPEQKTVFKLQLQAAIVSASTSWLPSKVLLLRVNIKATRDFVLGELLTSKLPSEHLTLNHALVLLVPPELCESFLGQLEGSTSTRK